jgi:hypothetical protein
MFGLNTEEIAVLKKLNSPVKIQNFLDEIEMNFEENGDTCLSPRMVLRERKCHCIEGAMLAAIALKINNIGEPLIVDLTANKNDFDHVIAVFNKNGRWGAISKTNHSVLRYREPVYNSIREMAMSYFHEYINDKGEKTLRSFSMPVNLSDFDYMGWAISEADVWEIPDYLAKVKHYEILTKKQIFELRKADEIEMRAGKLVEWENDKMKKNL